MPVIVGIDEVGRGCWAGPLVAAAVALTEASRLRLEVEPIGLRDSKKLSRKQREHLDGLIRSQVKTIGVGWVSPGEIDELGLTTSVQLAMLRAMKNLLGVCRDYDVIIIDGNYNFLTCDGVDMSKLTDWEDLKNLVFHNVQTMVRADDIVPAASAASIIAKVTRDKYMREIAVKYPGYGFESHVGYGTAKHIAALKKFGTTNLHRKSYQPMQKFLKIYYRTM